MGVLGPGPDHKREIRVLNRVLRWTFEGIEYEPDQRHAELVVKDLELEGAKPVSSPWTNLVKGSLEMESPQRSAGEATRYRALVARLNYLSQDRPHVQYVVKEASRRMSSPRESGWVALKRIGRYLAGALRTVQLFVWQDGETRLNSYSDSDSSGDRERAENPHQGAL